jgi:uncharacterized protein (DUF488 family)
MLHMAAAPQLVSIGYEGRTSDELISALVDAEVDVVIDVRLNAISRKPGLSKSRLSASLRQVGIEYVHLRALGNPRDNREPFWSGRIADGVRRFRLFLSEPGPAAELTLLVELAESRRVAVLCFERDHDRCHRQVVTDAVAARTSGATIAYA